MQFLLSLGLVSWLLTDGKNFDFNTLELYYTEWRRSEDKKGKFSSNPQITNNFYSILN